MCILTFHGFLKKSLRLLSGADTESVGKLSIMAASNPRLKAPLVLYMATLPKHQRRKLQRVAPELAVELTRYFDQINCEEDLIRVLQNGNVPKEYSKVYTSYLCKRNARQQDTELKYLIRNRIMELAEDKNISGYRISKEIGIDVRNCYAFLHCGDVSKLGLDKARQVLEYLKAQ